MTAVHVPAPAFKTETSPAATEKTVTGAEAVVAAGVVVGAGDGVAEVAVIVDVTGGGFIVIAGVVALAGEVGALVVAGGAVFDVQLKTAVKMKKDRTNMVKALPNIFLFNFMQMYLNCINNCIV